MTACCHVLRTSPNPPVPFARAARALRTGGRDGCGSTAVEGVLQPREQPLLARLELPLRALLAAQLRQLAQQALLVGVELVRGLHLDVHDEVAAAAAPQMRHAPAVQGD